MRIAVACCLALALPGPSRAEDVEHPTYLSWARHPVGTRIAIRSLTESPSSRITTTTTYTLAELRPDRAILTVRRTSDATGTVVTGAPETYVERRFFPLFPGVKPEDLGKPRNATAQGEETLTLAGRDFKTTWYDTKGSVDAGEAITRTWLSDEIPGRIAKTVVRVPVAATTITLELVEFSRP